MTPDDAIVRQFAWWLSAGLVYFASLFYLSLVDLFRRKYKTATRFLIAACLAIPAFLVILWLFPG